AANAARRAVSPSARSGAAGTSVGLGACIVTDVPWRRASRDRRRCGPDCDLVGTGLMVAESVPRTATVVVCAFDERRWSDLRSAVDSLGRQSHVVDDLIVVVDHNRDLFWLAEEELAN